MIGPGAHAHADFISAGYSEDTSVIPKIRAKGEAAIKEIETHSTTGEQPADAADRFFGLQADLEELFGRHVDLVSNEAIRNPFFRQTVDRTKVALYAA